ncbi:hypothetical protein EDD15DRAFT_2222239, partial [Pisolithus albus]
MKIDVDDVPPTPKRSTLASQRRQYRKLITPFRSPILNTTVEPSRKIECSSAKSESAGGPMPATIDSTSEQDLSSPPPQRQHVHSKKGTKTRTERAAAQFKSPIIQSGVSSSGVSSRPSIRLTPTVQMLEHRLQVLRRAVKVKEEKDEDVREDHRPSEAAGVAVRHFPATKIGGGRSLKMMLTIRTDWHSGEDGNAI